MKIWMICRKDAALNHSNLGAMFTVEVSRTVSRVSHFKCWPRKKDARAYIDANYPPDMFEIFALVPEREGAAKDRKELVGERELTRVVGQYAARDKGHTYQDGEPYCTKCGCFGPVDDPVDGRTECPAREKGSK